MESEIYEKKGTVTAVTAKEEQGVGTDVDPEGEEHEKKESQGTPEIKEPELKEEPRGLEDLEK